MARAVGLNTPSYYDVEADDDEVTGNISLATLAAIARTLHTTVIELVEGPDAPGGTTRSAFELVALVEARIAAEDLTVHAYGERIGWDLTPLFVNTEHLWKYPLVMLQALCDDVAVDWKEFIGKT